MTCSDDRVPENIAVIQNYTRKNPNHVWKITITPGSEGDNQTTISYVAIDLENKVVTNQVDKLAQIPTL